MTDARLAALLAETIIDRFKGRRKQWWRPVAMLVDALRSEILTAKDRHYVPSQESCSMQDTVPVTDFCGREIRVGDYLVYPVRQGSRMWLSRIRVTHILPGPTPTVRGLNNESRPVKLHKLSTVVVVPRPSEPQPA